MKRINYFQVISELFAFKTILDEKGNEYIVFQNSIFEEIKDVDDKTAFEAVENHIHLLDNIKKNEFSELTNIGANLGKALLASLKASFPNKSFYVFVDVSLGDSFIIRFHQKWKGEVPYYDVENLADDEKAKIIALEA